MKNKLNLKFTQAIYFCPRGKREGHHKMLRSPKIKVSEKTGPNKDYLEILPYIERH